MDAGWYVNNRDGVDVGTWEIDRKRFPNGLRSIMDHGRAKGVKSILWFEPERVTTTSWLFKNHPEWCLEARDLLAKIAHQGKWRLLDLGNPEAWNWLVHISANGLSHRPSRRPVARPTDCGKLVQVHDHRAIFQASPDELPVMAIHSL